MEIFTTYGEKFETQNPKSETSSKLKGGNQIGRGHSPCDFLPSDFGFVSDFDIRVSGLRLRRVSNVRKITSRLFFACGLEFARCHANAKPQAEAMHKLRRGGLETNSGPHLQKKAGFV
jgi:hypothetical protein